jgi:hypothetical protein
MKNPEISAPPPPNYPIPTHERRTIATRQENRNDPRPNANFYEIRDDSSVDSEEEITFLDPRNMPPSVDVANAVSPPQTYKYGNFARGNSGFGNMDIETESGEAESILASKTLEEKIQGLRM